MARTPNWGFTAFGGPLGGTIADDSGRFSAVDPFTVDRLIKALTAHDHSGSGHQVPNPSAAPVLAIDTTQGTLVGNTRYFYRIAYRDVWGLETAASDEFAIDTPGSVNAPGAPTAQLQAGGAIPAGTWRYAFTAVVGSTQTTLGSVAVVVVASTGGLNSALITPPPAPAGTGLLRLWRIGPSDIGWTPLHDFDGTEANWLDTYTTPSDPCACDPSTQPPTVNTTAATNSVVVSIPAADQPLFADLASSNIGSWVIYRTTQSGVYPTASLVAEVVTPPTDEAGHAIPDQLVVSFIDTGTALDAGSPQEINDTFPASPKIPFAVVEGVPQLPDPATTEEGTVMLVRANRLLYALLNGVWAPSGGLFEMADTPPNASGLPDGVPFVDTSTTPYTLRVSKNGVWQAVGGAGGGAAGPLLSPGGREFMPSVADDGTLDSTPYFAHPVVIDGTPTIQPNGDVTVSWEQPLNSQGTAYDPDFYLAVLYQAGGNISNSGNQTARTMTFHGLTPSESDYTVKVFLIIGTTTEAVGAEVALVPQPPDPAPGAVTSITMVPGDGKITLDWTDGSPVGASWDIECWDANNTVIRTDNVTAHPYDFAGLTNGMSYHFEIVPKAADGTPGPSNDTVELAAGLRPANVVVAPEDGALGVTFDAVAGATNYRISGYRTDNFTSFADVHVTTNSGTVSGLTNGVEYAVQVLVEDASHNPLSDFTVAVNGTPAVVPHGPAQNLVATSPSAGALHATWDPPAAGEPNNGGYDIYWNDGTTTGGEVTVPVGTHSHDWTGLPTGSYTFHVAALWTDGTYGADSSSVAVA